MSVYLWVQSYSLRAESPVATSGYIPDWEQEWSVDGGRAGNEL